MFKVTNCDLEHQARTEFKISSLCFLQKTVYAQQCFKIYLVNEVYCDNIDVDPSLDDPD